MSATCWIWLHGWCKNLSSQRRPREYVRRHPAAFFRTTKEPAMNHYTLAEMTPGLTEEFTVTVTPEMMDAFRAITGDVSPITLTLTTPGDAASRGGSSTGCWARAFSLRWRASICRRALPAPRRGVQICQADFHRRHADRQGHGCQRQRDRQRGRDQGRYHESGRQACDPRHHQGRLAK